MPVSSSRIEIATPAGRMPAFVAAPDSGRHPAVVVLVEAFGLVGNIERVAERIAGEGYVALAPDLYYRLLPAANSFGYGDLEGAIGAMSQLGDDMFVSDMGSALDYLASRGDTTDRVGVTGFCMGGRLSFLSACALPERVTCAAPFYGGGIPAHLDAAANIRCPLYLFFGEKDAYIPLEQVDQIGSRLEELGVAHSLKLYEGADHGFFCDERDSYHEAAATDSWSELKAFFRSHLG